MNDDQFSKIISRLDFISNALLINIVKDLEYKEQVIQLSNLGLKEIEIVKILNSTRDKVHTVLRNKK